MMPTFQVTYNLGDGEETVEVTGVNQYSAARKAADEIGYMDVDNEDLEFCMTGPDGSLYAVTAELIKSYEVFVREVKESK